jgi:hypothetical protein
MGISRFRIRPGVDLRNINSASPRGPFFLNRQRGAASTPIKSTLLPRFIAREAHRESPPVHAQRALSAGSKPGALVVSAAAGGRVPPIVAGCASMAPAHGRVCAAAPCPEKAAN